MLALALTTHLYAQTPPPAAGPGGPDPYTPGPGEPAPEGGAPAPERTPPPDGAPGPGSEPLRDGAEPPPGPPPPGEPPSGGQAGVPSPPGSGRGLMIRYDDTAGAGTIARPVVQLVASTGEVSAWPLEDDGKNGDTFAGDRAWTALAQVNPTVEYTVTVHDGSETAPELYRGTMSIDASTDAPALVIAYNVKGFDVQTRYETMGAPPQDGAPAPGVPPMGNGGGAASPPQPGALQPASGAWSGGPAGTGGKTLTTGFYGAVLGAAAVGLAWGVTALLAARRRVRALTEPPTGRAFGLAALGDVPVVWVVPTEVGPGFLRDVLVELAPWGDLLVVPRADSTFDGLAAGTLHRLPADRPDPVVVAAAARRFRRVGLVCEGVEALEAPLANEPPGAVIDELKTNARKLPLLCVARVGEPVPTGAKLVELRGDADTLEAEGVRLQKADGRWRLSGPAPR